MERNRFSITLKGLEKVWTKQYDNYSSYLSCTTQYWKNKTCIQIKHENQVILLMTTDAKKLHYLTVKSLSALLKEITPNHKGDFYCLNSYRTEKKT